MLKKVTAGLALAALLSASVVGGALAQDEDGPQTAAAGNGGVVNSSASGGAVNIGSTNTGGTTGSTIGTAVQDALVSGDDIAAAVIAAILGED